MLRFRCTGPLLSSFYLWTWFFPWPKILDSMSATNMIILFVTLAEFPSVWRCWKQWFQTRKVGARAFFHQGWCLPFSSLSTLDNRWPSRFLTPYLLPTLSFFLSPWLNFLLYGDVESNDSRPEKLGLELSFIKNGDFLFLLFLPWITEDHEPQKYFKEVFAPVIFVAFKKGMKHKFFHIFVDVFELTFKKLILPG